MRVIRTILWMAVTAIAVAFVAMNWDPAPVRFWPLGNGDFLRFDWPVGFTALFFFLLGFAPMWLLHRAARWRMKRQMAALQHSAQAAAAPSLSTDSLAQTPSDSPAN